MILYFFFTVLPYLFITCIYSYLEILKDHLKPGMRALDVGSGSGYLTACMALMVGTSGKVVGIGRTLPLHYSASIRYGTVPRYLNG